MCLQKYQTSLETIFSVAPVFQYEEYDIIRVVFLESTGRYLVLGVTLTLGGFSFIKTPLKCETELDKSVLIKCLNSISALWRPPTDKQVKYEIGQSKQEQLDMTD